jgi:predicted RNA-binding Zn ribbon-like protein
MADPKPVAPAQQQHEPPRPQPRQPQQQQQHEPPRPQPRQPQPAASAYEFDLDGGRSCLDFVNTCSSSGDHLATYADLVTFADQSRLLAPDVIAWLRTEGNSDPAAAQGIMVRAIRLREAMRSIFTAIAAGKKVPHRELAMLNFDIAVTMTHAEVQPASRDAASDFAWGWTRLNLDAPIWPITRSAADLLTSEDERKLVRLCSASDCAWLFLDTSKNRRRQWCSMQSCGNREKARRHYRRRRARAKAEPEAVSGA